MTDARLADFGSAVNHATTAVRLLAIGEGPIKTRLAQAAGEFGLVFPECVPEDLRARVAALQETFRAHPEEYAGEGLIVAAVRHMRAREAKVIAEELFDLARLLEQRFVEAARPTGPTTPTSRRPTRRRR